MEMELDHNS